MNRLDRKRKRENVVVTSMLTDNLTLPSSGQTFFCFYARLIRTSVHVRFAMISVKIFSRAKSRNRVQRDTKLRQVSTV